MYIITQQFFCRKADMVAVFGETTGYYALQNILNRMTQDPTGRRMLK